MLQGTHAPQAVQPAVRLKITEIFHSIQGEGLTAGVPTAFVRLTGCPLRCGYCDTAYAFSGGEYLELAAIMAQVGGFGASHVTVTGGEPLAQAGCLDLLTGLCDAGYQVSLETSGALDVAEVDRRVVLVLDLKTPASGECARNRYANVEHLKPGDQVKFVLADRADYDWAVATAARYRLGERATVLLSPVHGALEAARLADWMLADRLSYRLQLQLHKLLWGEVPGR
ncbi:7-carboxy-7-deazaguanine synthase QueE [Immundisolibacter sp.]|uniref:7-carboxy-7-deazaguanine synthase QueE n=1 Tax=Immundisolibacter sp. TaxID=1934948 RepID=UPI00356836E2